MFPSNSTLFPNSNHLCLMVWASVCHYCSQPHSFEILLKHLAADVHKKLSKIYCMSLTVFHLLKCTSVTLNRLWVQYILYESCVKPVLLWKNFIFVILMQRGFYLSSRRFLPQNRWQLNKNLIVHKNQLHINTVNCEVEQLV